MTTRVYMIRHAQSAPSAKLPESEWPLSAQGVTQATQLGPLLESLRISRLFSSPYLRCLDTVGPFARRSGLEVSVVDELHERKIATGPRADFADLWERSWNDLSFALPGCESSLDAQTRFVDAVYRLLPQDEDGVGICAHGNVIGLFLNHLDPAFGLAGANQLRNPDVVGFVYENEVLSWDRSFGLHGIDGIATHPQDTPIDW